MTINYSSLCSVVLLLALSPVGRADAQSNFFTKTNTSTTSIGIPTVATPYTPNRMQIRLEADGDLRIVGTYFDDFVQITRSDGILHIRAEQRIDGEAFWDEYRDIRVEKVTKIFFTGHEGNDRFVANTEILTQAEGGDHDDTIVCGGSIHGGKGNDTLIASGYRYGGTLFGSYVDGGENNDEIWGSSLPDYLDGGSGLNTIHGDADDIIVNNSSPFTQEYGPAQGNTGELSLD